jgi:lysophospholipase L1-like esterase
MITLHKPSPAYLIVFALVGVHCWPDCAAAQATAKKTVKTPEKENPEFANITDDPAWPRVLLIGDSISMGYTLPVRNALRGKANIHRPPENCGPTTRGVERLDSWLGEGHWNVIHFNFGLHDLKYIDGKPQVSLEDYEKNLRTIVARLKRTGAKLVWCSTTPVPTKSSPPRHNEDVLAYNAAAEKVMKENGISVDDLYAIAQLQIEKIQRPDNVHFTKKGSEALATQVAKVILESLNGDASPADK